MAEDINDPHSLLGGPVFYRKRMYPTAMQATFPGVNGVNTIVIGHAELTADKTSTRWVLTVLHEHFHQLVYSQPGYYADVEKLGLAHGDKTGMWMLNYPFPYDSARVQEKFTAMTHALLDALAQTDQPELEKKVAARWCIRSAPPRRCCWTARGRSGSGTFSHTASDSPTRADHFIGGAAASPTHLLLINGAWG